MSFPKRRDSKPLSLLPKVRINAPGLNMLTALVVILVLVHILLEMAGGLTPSLEDKQVLSARYYYVQFGLSWNGFSHGKIWQVGSYGLLHANWFHLLVNVLMLWLVGGRVVHILGGGKTFQIIAWGVLAGGLVHLLTGLLMLRTGYPESQLVGISGACLALLLTLTTLSPDSRMWPIPVSGKNLGLGLIITELLLWLMQPGLGLPVFSYMGEQFVRWFGAELFMVSHACHLGGGLAGWWLARRLLAPTPSLESLQKMRKKREKDMKLGDLG